MEHSRFERFRTILRSIIVGEGCVYRKYFDRESAVRLYLEGNAEDTAEVFRDTDTFLSLFRYLLSKEQSDWLRYPERCVMDREAAGRLWRNYFNMVDEILTVLAGDILQQDRAAAKGMVDLLRDIPVIEMRGAELPMFCKQIPRDILLADETRNILMAFVDPMDIFGELTEEEKEDPDIVCKVLEDFKHVRFYEYEERFEMLCDSIPHKLLKNAEVRELIFETGIPAMIYSELLTDEEQLDDDNIYRLLKMYESPRFPDAEEDYRKLRKMWAEDVAYALPEGSCARRIYEDHDTKEAEAFFKRVYEFLYEIGNNPALNIEEQRREYLEKMKEKDGEVFTEALKPYASQLEWFDQAALNIRKRSTERKDPAAYKDRV